MRYWLYGCVSLFFVLMLFSCMKDESYTTVPSDTLTFSTDTVAFDTIISGIPTNTYTFKVYNRNAKSIRIPRVRLENGSQSFFYVNVDGTPLQNGYAADFEISPGDSMIVYLFAKVRENDCDLPVETKDALIFTTEAGIEQEVTLTASGQDVITYNVLHVKKDTTLSAIRPYRIMDSVVVDREATLILAEGTRYFFHSNARLIVHGTLQINGTLDKPVELRGDRMGNMFAGQPYDRIPGQWGGVVFTKDSYGNYISYADIHSGTFGIQVDSSDVSQSKLVMENSIIHNTSKDGLNTRMANIYVGNSQITNAGGNCVKIRGGDVTFVHCTIARFYVFTGGDGVALDFANYDGDIRLPLTRAQFANSIITGYASDEIMGGTYDKESKEDDYNYAFFNCLINTPQTEKEDERLVNCLWDISTGDGQVSREGNFTPDFDLKALTFSFELNPKSPAVGNADVEITNLTYPKDMQGRSRATSPDIGCYQHVDVQ